MAVLLGEVFITDEERGLGSGCHHVPVLVAAGLNFK